jgi:signal transduction histidine kinase
MSRKSILTFFIAFLLLITVVVLDRFSFNKLKEYSYSVEHTRDVISGLRNLEANLKSAQIYSRKYADLTKQQFYSIYEAERNQLPANLQAVRSLVKDNPAQLRRVDTLTQVISTQVAGMKERNIVQLILDGEEWRLQPLYETNQLIKRTIDAENTLLQERRAQLDQYTFYSSILTVIFSTIAISIIVVIFVFNVIIGKKRKWLEGFLESVLNTSENGIVTYKAIRERGKIIDFKVEFANNSIKRLLGIDPSAVIGKRLGEMQSFVKGGDLFARFIEVVDRGKQVDFETLYDHNSLHKWFHVQLAKMSDGLTATFHDISQIKKYQEELQSNINWLGQSNKELEQYAYVASHDLQEPLRKIMVYANVLETSAKEKLDEKNMGHLHKISSAAARMSVLIADILNFSGLKREPVYERIDLNEVLQNVLEDQELKIVQLNAQITAEQLPVIDAIPLQMNQLFYNLVSNSLKFANTDVEPQLKVSCKRLSEAEIKKYSSLNPANIYYQIEFSDNGIGFKPEYVEQIFGLFKRLNDKQKFPGSGIGLALCKKVVENHNGIITATGHEGVGATFIIILPETQTPQ